MTSSDLAADCISLDGGETVSVSLRRSDGIIAVTVAGALRRALARQERPVDGVSLAEDGLVWHVPQAALPEGYQLQPGDHVVAGDEIWTIIAAEKQSLGTRWRCVCRRNGA